MSVFHAICPRCDKSLYLGRNREDEYVCPHCGRSFSYAMLQTSDNLVDVEAAKIEYGRAQQYFAKNDYRTAEKHFDKVREIDRSNFFAEYFYRLCDIRSINETGKLCGAEIIVSLIDEPIVKMAKTPQPDGVKRMFLLHAFTEVRKLLEELYTAIAGIYAGDDELETRRKEYLIFARGVRRVTLIDKDAAMLNEKDILSPVVAVCGLALRALRYVAAGSIRNSVLCLPTSPQYDEARALYGVFSHFLRTVSPNYVFPDDSETLAENFAFNRKVRVIVSEYERENKPYERGFLSVKGEKLTHMLYYCRTAFDYTYHSVFNRLGGRGRTPETLALMKDALYFAQKLFMPRVSVDADGGKVFDIPDFNKLRRLSAFFNNFCTELALADKNALAADLDDFYSDLFELVRYHYGMEVPKLKAELGISRAQKNKKYFYYRNFLFGIVSCATVALTEVVAFDAHRMGDRLKLLRYGKDAADDLLYLFDYHIEDIEKIPKFASLPAVYGYINTNLRAYA